MKINFLYPEGKSKALTFSYDDGVIYDERLIEIFDKYGMKGAFNINSGLFGEGRRLPAEKIREMYANHEINVHGLMHVTLPMLPKLQMVEEMMEDKRNLERLSGRIIRGAAYAYGWRNEETQSLLKTLDFSYVRLAGNSRSFIPPYDFYEWTMTCHHNNDLMATGENFLKARHALALMSVWGHSYEFNDQNNWELIEEFCKKMAFLPEIWYATPIEICDYVTATRSVHTNVDGTLIHNTSGLTLWVKSENGPVQKIAPGETITLEQA